MVSDIGFLDAMSFFVSFDFSSFIGFSLGSKGSNDLSLVCKSISMTSWGGDLDLISALTSALGFGMWSDISTLQFLNKTKLFMVYLALHLCCLL